MSPPFRWFLVAFTLVVLVAVLMGCTFVHGATQMDDRWCAAHPNASEWRCWK
jgi:hypothetical protein